MYFLVMDKFIPASLGNTPKEIYQAWRAYGHPWPGQVTVGWCCDFGLAFEWGQGGLERCFSIDGMPVVSEPTPDELNKMHDSLERGTLQIESRRITGLGSFTYVNGGQVMRVLHQATGIAPAPDESPEPIPQACVCDKCGERDGEEPHFCPYQTDVKDNRDPYYCNCCTGCRRDCLESI